MKNFIFSICLLAFVSTVNVQVTAQGKTKMSDTSSATFLRHVVLFKFKDGTTPAQVKEVADAFSVLPSKINTITGYEWGTNVSPENLAQGFTHCFLVTFKDAAGRDFYLPHPAHKAFGKVLSPYLDKVLVFDFINEPAH
ncbi:MAG: Dabb family protein [Ginsengibacter sp.]